MATVAERLANAHEELLKLYTTIPVLTPCLDAIKTNQAEFVALNNRIRHLQEEITVGHGKTERIRKQLDRGFTLGKKADMERQYQQELIRVQSLETERRATLRQRDDVVTVRYKLHSDRDKLLHMTRQLKRLTESVFDRSKDEVANADFPEELYWQLELKECDEKIGKCRQDLGKFQLALTALSRAANLSEAALMAFLGYVDAAYKVWSAEYALQASRKMRLYLRVELSLSNAYSNFQSARASVPQIVHHMDVPLPASSVQGYFEPMGRSGLGRKLNPVKEFDKEPELRAFIAHLRGCHKAVERIVEQETARLNSLSKYRDSVVPKLAKIRRHVFQDSCLGGYKVEGWEDEHGRSLLGTEADLLVRGGVVEVQESSARVSAAIAEAAAEAAAAAASGSFLPVSLSLNGSEGESSSSSRHNRRSSRGDNSESANGASHGSGAPGQGETNGEGQMIVRVGRAPLSTVAPNNQLGSQVLMEVDRDRRAKAAAAAAAAAASGSSTGRRSRSKFWRRDGSRSRSRSRARSRSITDGGDEEIQDVQNNRSQARRGSGHIARPPIFSLSRTNTASDDAVVPTGDNEPASQSTPPLRTNTPPSSSRSEPQQRPTHRHNVPSLSISHADGLTSHPLDVAAEHRPRVMTMDEYVGVGEVERSFDEGYTDVDMPFVYAYLDPTVADHHRSLPATSSAVSTSVSSAISSPGVYIPISHGRSLSISTLNPDAEYESNLIPTYGEHLRHRTLNPEEVFLVPATSTSFGSRIMAADIMSNDNPPPFSANSEDIISPTTMLTLGSPQSAHRFRSRSLSPSPHHRNQSLSSSRLVPNLSCVDELGRIQETSSDGHLPLLDNHHNPPPEYTA
ncbi:hypothetical protein BGW42_002112 [Actinomortierella wolfii]|nr:hypothetical protein BGW42_002112 [Actinomortierella wolfii]